MTKKIFSIVLIFIIAANLVLQTYSGDVYEDENGYYRLKNIQIFVPMEYFETINSVTEDIKKLDYVTETFIMTDLNDEDVFLQEYIHIFVCLEVQNESEFNSVFNTLFEKEYAYFVTKDYLLMKKDCLFGDIDSDGKVTSADAREILRIASGISVAETDFRKIAADVDGDGVITVVDARIVLQMSVGIIKVKSINGSNER